MCVYKCTCDALLGIISLLFSQIESAATSDELQMIANQNFDVLVECGFNKPVVKLQLQDKFKIRDSVGNSA